jgi:hypothetical protein
MCQDEREEIAEKNEIESRKGKEGKGRNRVKICC